MKNYNMDETVNDFLKEINKILPEDHILKKAKQKDCGMLYQLIIYFAFTPSILFTICRLAKMF